MDSFPDGDARSAAKVLFGSFSFKKRNWGAGAKPLQSRAAAYLPEWQRGAAAVDIRGLSYYRRAIAGESGLPSCSTINSVRNFFGMDTNSSIVIEGFFRFQLFVLSPTMKSVPVSVSLTVYSNYTFSNVKQNVDRAIRGYFSGELVGKGVKKADLGNLISSVAGVQAYNITSPAEDIAAKESELPMLGTLTITQA